MNRSQKSTYQKRRSQKSMPWVAIILNKINLLRFYHKKAKIC